VANSAISLYARVTARVYVISAEQLKLCLLRFDVGTLSEGCRMERCGLGLLVWHPYHVIYRPEIVCIVRLAVIRRRIAFPRPLLAEG